MPASPWNQQPKRGALPNLPLFGRHQSLAWHTDRTTLLTLPCRLGTCPQV
jgi:hypothetical protein